MSIIAETASISGFIGAGLVDTDTGLMLALDAVSRGWFIRDVGLLYREWPGQVTNHATHSAQVEWDGPHGCREGQGGSFERVRYGGCSGM